MALLTFRFSHIIKYNRFMSPTSQIYPLKKLVTWSSPLFTTKHKKSVNTFTLEHKKPAYTSKASNIFENCLKNGSYKKQTFLSFFWNYSKLNRIRFFFKFRNLKYDHWTFPVYVLSSTDSIFARPYMYSTGFYCSKSIWSTISLSQILFFYDMPINQQGFFHLYGIGIRT